MDLSANNCAALASALLPAVKEAAALVESIRRKGVEGRQKADTSPVTEADELAEPILACAANKLTPGLAIVGEEAFAAGLGPDRLTEAFWLIDPVDGTKEFIKGGTDYTVNIALVTRQGPLLGLVCAPHDGRIWMGGRGFGAQLIHADGQTRDLAPSSGDDVALASLRVIASRSHRDEKTDALIAALRTQSIVSRGSSLKLCAVADGEADLYPRYGPTCEWDIAAGHAVLLGAGGTLTQLDGSALPYAKPKFLNGGFLAARNAALISRVVDLA